MLLTVVLEVFLSALLTLVFRSICLNHRAALRIGKMANETKFVFRRPEVFTGILFITVDGMALLVFSSFSSILTNFLV